MKPLSIAIISSISETDFVAAPLAGQAPLLVQFTDTSTDPPVSWSWDFGDGATSSAQNVAHVYTVPGSYTVSMTAGNASSTGTRIRTGYITVLACTNAPVNLASLAFSNFTDLDSAYAQAMDNDLIMLQAYEFGSGLLLNRDIRVTLKGGYDCGYVDNPGAATLRGILRVQNGSVKVDKLHLR